MVNAKSKTIAEITFPQAATIGKVEEAYNALKNSRDYESITLDFSKSQFIEVPTLIFLIAVIAQRKRLSLNTVLRLPEAKRTRDFLRVWGFQDAIYEACGESFISFVHSDDRRYFGENKTSAENTYYGFYKRSEGIQYLVTEKFFAIQSMKLTSGVEGPRLVLDESQRWNSKLVKAVLEKHLVGPDSYIKSRIVYESMTNAIRHAAAKIIQTTSMFDDPGTKRSEGSAGFFTLVYWDDGDSIIDTLKNALKQGRKVRSKTAPVIKNRFHWTLTTGEGAQEGECFSDFTPDTTTPDHLLLLSSTFPGITRDPDGKGFASEELKQQNPEFDSPGMGLHILLNTVVDIFGGNVAFRSGQHFMSLRKGVGDNSGEACYLARIKHFDSLDLPFLGNMITIRLPLRVAT